MKIVIEGERGNTLYEGEDTPSNARRRMARLLRQERRAHVSIKRVRPRMWALGPVPFAYRLLIVALIA